MSYGRYALALSAAAMIASGEAFLIYLGSFQAEGNQTECQQFAQSQDLLNIMSIPNEVCETACYRHCPTSKNYLNN
jgi:hypothetical protein